MRFQDKVAIVTGAGNGIGLGMARAFAAEGAQVVIADINATAGAVAAAEIKASGGQAISVPTDVSDEGQVAAMTAAVVDQLGRIDILVNNAGVVVHKLLVDLDLDAWQRQLDVQLTGPFLTIKHVGRHMRTRGGTRPWQRRLGRQNRQHLVGVRRDGPGKRGAALCRQGRADDADQGGGHGAGRLRRDCQRCGPGADRRAVAAGGENISSAYKTRYLAEVPLQRVGQTTDIAEMVLFLCSDAANWITGQLYLVDGGLMAGHYSFQGNHDFELLRGHADAADAAGDAGGEQVAP